MDNMHIMSFEPPLPPSPESYIKRSKKFEALKLKAREMDKENNDVIAGVIGPKQSTIERSKLSKVAKKIKEDNDVIAGVIGPKPAAVTKSRYVNKIRSRIADNRTSTRRSRSNSRSSSKSRSRSNSHDSVKGGKRKTGKRIRI